LLNLKKTEATGNMKNLQEAKNAFNAILCFVYKHRFAGLLNIFSLI